MDIIYSFKAKEDLSRIDWRTRERIITTLSTVSKQDKDAFRPLTDSEYIKLSIDNHIVIGKTEGEELNIITIQKKHEMRLPE